MYKFIEKNNIKFIEESDIFIKNEKFSELNKFVSFYDIIDLSGKYSGYYLAVRESDSNDGKLEYVWCDDEAIKESTFVISFEDVLDRVSDETKEVLLFHLDIFS